MSKISRLWQLGRVGKFINGWVTAHGLRMVSALLGVLFVLFALLQLESALPIRILAFTHHINSTLALPPVNRVELIIYVAGHIVIGISLIAARFLPFARLLLFLRVIDMIALWIFFTQRRFGDSLLPITTEQQVLLRDLVLVLIAFIISILITQQRRNAS